MTRVVHLGLGAFHRAHQALYTEDAGGWAICGVAQRSRAVIDALRASGGRYTVIERGPREDRTRAVGVIRETLHARDDAAALAARLAAPDTHVVTMTVTEAGYGSTPGGPVAQLAAGLAARRAAGVDAPLAVLSCDNLPRNGELVRRALAAACDGDQLGWIDAHVRFPTTVVDRIVPAPADPLAVIAEPYSQWVIEAFDGPRPAWERGGAQLVADTRPFEAVKLRLVNASHSALAYLGLPAGHRTVAEAVADDRLAAFVRELLRDELLPTVAAPPGVDLDAFVERMLERFANPRIAHPLEQIAAGGEHKLPPRLLDPARELLAGGRDPAGIRRVVGAWLRGPGGDPAVLGDLRGPLLGSGRGGGRALGG